VHPRQGAGLLGTNKARCPVGDVGPGHSRHSPKPERVHSGWGSRFNLCCGGALEKRETSRKRRPGFSEKCIRGRVRVSWARIKPRCPVGDVGPGHSRHSPKPERVHSGWGSRFNLCCGGALKKNAKPPGKDGPISLKSASQAGCGVSWARIKPDAHLETEPGLDSEVQISKNDRVQKGAVAPNLHALRPPWPAQGGWPVLGQTQISPATPGAPPGAKTVLKRTSAWSEDGPKTDHGALVEDEGGREGPSESPLAGLTLESNLEK